MKLSPTVCSPPSLAVQQQHRRSRGSALERQLLAGLAGGGEGLALVSEDSEVVAAMDPEQLAALREQVRAGLFPTTSDLLLAVLASGLVRGQ